MVPPHTPPPSEISRKQGLSTVWILILLALVLMLSACGGGQGETAKAPTEPAPPIWDANVLRGDEIPRVNSQYTYAEALAYTVLGSDYQRQEIRSVTFLDTLAGMPEDAWDVSEAGDGKVMAWVIPNGDLYDLYIAGEGGVSAGTSCLDLFSGYQNAVSITFGDAFHTEKTEDMGYMFCDCQTLTELDLDHFDTSNVRNMYVMFNRCLSLTSLDLDSFDTAMVRNMRYMFYGCNSLTQLDLDSFDTSNVTTMEAMFYECHSLTSLNTNSFNTSKVNSMRVMFYGCDSLKRLDLSSFDTSNARNMSRMFNSCVSLTNLVLSDRFVTTNADTTDMFDDCPASSDWGHLVN